MPRFRPPWVIRVLCLAALINAAATDPSQDSVTDYAPQVNVQCPDISTTPLIRVFTPQNQSLHPDETAFINNRETYVLPDAWSAWLGDGSSLSYNASAFVVCISCALLGYCVLN